MKKILSIILIVITLLSLCVSVNATEAQAPVSIITITNCDTGRAIADDELAQFIYHEINDTEFALTSVKGGYYVDFTQGGLQPAWSEVVYTKIEKEFGRIQIAMPDGSLLADGDTADNIAESLTLYDSSSEAIETGWYFTTEEDVPIKIMALGDSLTYGVNPDSTDINTSYRGDLSEYLMDYFDKVAFTGSIKTETTIKEKWLLRHSGYPGYVIEDAYGNPDHPGINEMVPPMMQKYRPDIVVMMLGTNDCAMLAGQSDMETAMDELMVRWENLIRSITFELPDDGLLICCSVPPMLGERDEKFNARLEEKVNELETAGLKITFLDTAAAFEGHKEYISSDGTHLSDLGNSALAEVICTEIASNYGTNGVKGEGQAITFVEESVPEESKPESSVPEVQEEVEQDNNEEATDNTMLIILIAMVVLMLIAIILLLVFRKKMKE